MSSQAGDGDGGGVSQEFTLSEENTFSFLPGAMTGVTCPSCFNDQLLKEVITSGECNSCGATLEVTLTARAD